MTELAAIETPRLLLSRPRLDRNLARMQACVAQGPAPLRLHVKTAKSVALALEALGGKPGPIVVSTLGEADVFARAGFTDILYGVGLAPNKIAHVAALTAQGARMTVLIDSLAQARALRAAGDIGAVSALIEITIDGLRGGLPAGDPAIVVLAQALGNRFAGIMTYGGQGYVATDTAGLVKAAEIQLDVARAVARDLKAAGFPPKVVSVGSTPTTLSGVVAIGATEVRAGVFVFNDVMQAEIGVCDQDDVALSVLTTIIGHQPASGWLVVDAGWRALSLDKSQHGSTYGVVCAGADRAPCVDLRIMSLSQEHGLIGRADREPIDVATFPIGAQLQILPHHACSTAMGFKDYLLCDKDFRPLATIPRDC
jgi:D-serine deaminase-like pyridoxal phosphate-dependent protein